jgi:hypothetical protein
VRQVVPDESLTPQLEQRRASDPSAAEPNGSAASATASIVSKAADEAGGGEGGTQPLPTNAERAAGQPQVIAAPLGPRVLPVCHLRVTCTHES